MYFETIVKMFAMSEGELRVKHDECMLLLKGRDAMFQAYARGGSATPKEAMRFFQATTETEQEARLCEMLLARPSTLSPVEQILRSEDITVTQDELENLKHFEKWAISGEQCPGCHICA